MQNIILGDGSTLSVASVHGSAMNGRLQLIISIPEKGNSFNKLKQLFSDTQITKEITIEYFATESSNEASNNVQTDFTILTALRWDPGTFTVTLSQPTDAEREVELLRGQVATMATTIQRVQEAQISGGNLINTELATEMENVLQVVNLERGRP